ncbi:MAG: FCD domain-containing protein [Hyphomicrobiales bacterium]|nr:FCD domain-containing protein [Hyphomicrobiales bacterium]
MPHVASEAAARCGSDHANRLEVLTARLGRHLVDRDAPALVGEFLAFLRMLAKVARSPFVELMIAEASAAPHLTAAAGELEKSRIEAFFALHVGLLHALQARDGRRAATLASHCLGAFEALLDPSTSERSRYA